MTKQFSAFLKRRDRQNKDNLRLLGKLLSRSGFDVKDRLSHHEDPYLYVAKPIQYDPIIETLDFGGIRIYTRGQDIISFRPQNRENAEPYGAAYLLDVEGMYKDLMKEKNDVKTGKHLVRYIVEEVLNYFLRAAKAQTEDDKDVDDDSLGKIVTAMPSVGDYASSVGRSS